MATTRQLPADWELELEVPYDDTVMEREYTRLEYRLAPGDQIVRTTGVQEPNSFEGWYHLVPPSE